MNKEYREQQIKRFSYTERKRFYWQTTHPYVSLREKDLLKIVNETPGESLLEVGCGEAANVINMVSDSRNRKWQGVDISEEKIRFCQSHNIGDFMCADVLNLPFKNESFDIVFARDLLHHVDDMREYVVKEMIRVCKKKGKIVLIEANGRKIIYKMFGFVDRSEIGVLNSTPENITALFEKYRASISRYSIMMKEPSALFRLIFHYKFGISRFGCERFLDKVSKVVNNITAKIYSKDRWGYIVVIAEKK